MKRNITQETNIWRGRPSQIINTGTMLGFLFLTALVTALIYFIYNYEKNAQLAMIFSALYLILLFFGVSALLQTHFTNYYLSTQRLRIKTGILSRSSEEIELYRVKDTAVFEPLFLRLFGLGNIKLITSDKTSPEVLLRAVRNPDEFNDRIRTLVEQCRTEKGVREID